MATTQRSKSNIFISIVELFCFLDVTDYLSANEIRILFVEQLQISKALSADDIRTAFRYQGKESVVSRSHTKNKVKYYAAATSVNKCLLFPDRLPSWKIPQVEHSQNETEDNVKEINYFFSLTENIITLTPEKIIGEILPLTQNWLGFTGTKVDNLFRQSFIDGPLQEMGMGKSLPKSFDLKVKK